VFTSQDALACNPESAVRPGPRAAGQAKQTRQARLKRHPQRRPVTRPGCASRAWASAGRVVDDLATTHPDLRAKLRPADLMRYGHAMAVPVPGRRGRVRFAHADLTACSVFEEAFTLGTLAGRV
jgi:hypothetical protein